jgi:hypothetical protein
MAQHAKTWVIFGSVMLGGMFLAPAESEAARWRRAWRYNYACCPGGYYTTWQQPAYVQTQTAWHQPMTGDPCAVQPPANAADPGAAPQPGDRAAPPPPVEPAPPRTFEPAPEPAGGDR